ncbi:MAG: CapA family protein [Alphaproteobacteria bacterium]|nr:CapA family protein [Alphaproteobacteria bacterium]
MGVTLFACGDIVNSKGNSNFIDNKLQDIVQNSDISICNFEAPIESHNMQSIDKAGPHIYQSKESIRYLKQSGFNLLSLANNHIYDYGDAGLMNTIREIDANGLEYVGAGSDYEQAYQQKIIEKNGLKIGFIAACENEFGCLHEDRNRSGYCWLFNTKIDDNVMALKQQVDFVILIAHAGVEDLAFPIKEWRERYKRLCDLGVDVILGHHPHVPQGYESYNESQIFYSLGNFYFDTSAFQDSADDSFSVILKLAAGKKIEFEIIYHKYIGSSTCLVEADDVAFKIDHLNGLLTENYLALNEQTCVKLFNDYYHSYYRTALGVPTNNKSLISELKNVIKRLFFDSRYVNMRLLMLLHNIKIDTHRFVVQRAIQSILNKPKN